MDIIVTTPKSQMENAKKEAEHCISKGGGIYFRRFSLNKKPKIEKGNKVFYVEDGYLRGYATVLYTQEADGQICEVTGKQYLPGFYVVMDAKSWKWIKPIPMKGFQGYRYLKDDINIEVVGNWLDKKPI